MYISSFMRYTVKPSVLAIQPKHKNTITIILNKDVPIQEAKTDNLNYYPFPLMRILLNYPIANKKKNSNQLITKKSDIPLI